jgi:uncharacterized protein
MAVNAMLSCPFIRIVSAEGLCRASCLRRSHWSFDLGLVINDEQAQRLPKALEPFLFEDFSADLWAMVEDELLLVLPPFPLHERDECPAKEDLEALEPSNVASEPEVKKREDNPFSVLAGLKTTKH